MFLRSKVQEMILRRRSRAMNGGGGGGCAQQGGHLAGGQHADDSLAAPCDGGGDGGKGVAGRATFGSPRLLHSSSLPAGSRMPGAEMPALCSMSPTSVLDASAVFASSPVDGSGSGSVSKRRPWYDGCAGPQGLADALDCADDNAQRERSVLAHAAVSTRAIKAQAARLVRSCSLDRRVEFGVKNKSSWLPLRAVRMNDEAAAAAAAAAMPEEMEPSSEDYTCVISRGPNPRTVHIFGDRVVEGDRDSSPPQPINLNLPAVGATGFLSL